jgi:hypothetical protein
MGLEPGEDNNWCTSQPKLANEDHPPKNWGSFTGDANGEKTGDIGGGK